MHHERLDGSGYHRGAAARDQPVARARAGSRRRVPRDDAGSAAPARLTAEQAADELARDARAGQLEGECVAAVLEAAGQARPRLASRPAPAGLSERELEVLRLVAVGYSNPDIAGKLVISPPYR